MKLAILALFAVFSIHLSAETFTDKETGVSVNLPAGWHVPEIQNAGLLISPPKGRFGIRIKHPPMEQKTLWDAINGIIATFEINSEKGEKKYPYRVIMIEPFQARSGLSGFRVTTGNIEKSGKQIPNVFNYMILNEDEKPVCVCLYASAGYKTPEAADALILPSLK